MENIEQPAENDVGAPTNLEEGSMLGKFKDATSLMNAYNNLQAEFTRKSQKLANLEKQLMTEELSQTTDSASQSAEQNISADTASENSTCTNDNPQIDNFDALFASQLDKFAENVTDAKDYADDIKKQIIENNLMPLTNAVELGYKLIKSQPAQLINDPEFVEKYILGNTQVREKVIAEYIKSLAKREFAPKVITGNSSTMVGNIASDKPKTLSDANKIFSKMLEK